MCGLQALIEPQRSEGRDNKGANRHRGGSGGNFPRMRQPWRNTSASFAKKGGRGRRIAPHESSEPPAIKRGHTKSKIPPWRAPGRGGGVSPHKKSVTPPNIKITRPQAACSKKQTPSRDKGGGVSPCKKKRNHALHPLKPPADLCCYHYFTNSFIKITIFSLESVV